MALLFITILVAIHYGYNAGLIQDDYQDNQLK